MREFIIIDKGITINTNKHAKHRPDTTSGSS